MWSLVLHHLFLVFSTSILAAFISILAAIFVTSEIGKDFMPITRNLANIGQIFPPVAVLAICIPILGFGFYPTAISLFLYGILPIFENTISGIQSINSNIILSARGMGMSTLQIIYKVRLPLALPFIFAGFRISVIINLGTATIGSMVAAKGLGEVIIAGILTDNQAFILQGAIIIAFLSVFINSFFEYIEQNYLNLK